MVLAISEQFLDGILVEEAEDIRILHKLKSKNVFHILINYGCGFQVVHEIFALSQTIKSFPLFYFLC